MSLTQRAGMFWSLVACLAACSPPEDSAETTDTLPHWAFDSTMIFPADRSLTRPEDGVALPDGRLIVADQNHGLRLIAPDGSSRPFGSLVSAGYVHRPPEMAGGANGVRLDPAGTHVLVSDVFRGGIYRVEVATERSELVYRHEFGVNTARADRQGGIWFSQSTRNRPANGEAELWRAVARPIPDGALWYLPPSSGSARSPVRLVADSLLFPNGIALDETGGFLYLSETKADRILRFRIDDPGQVADRTVLLEVASPDNIELDSAGRLWIASPIRNEILVRDPRTDTTHSAFRIVTAKSEAVLAEAERRTRAGESVLELLTADLWAPAPGPITGMIISPNNGPVYLTGLGNALIRLVR